MVDDAQWLDQIEAVVAPVLASRGLDLVDTEWRREGRRWVLRFYVDKPGGVGIEDCQRASRELGDVLDASALIEEGYDLDVSSPGLDRQLRKDREFRWALGKRVQCWVAGGQEFRGRLVDVDAARLTLDHEGERVEVARERVTKAKLEAEVPWPRRPAV
jgi:ribosome maturation factor RimP